MNSRELCAKLRAEGDSAAEAYCSKYAFGGTKFSYQQEAQAAQRARDPMWAPTAAAVESGMTGEALTVYLDRVEAEMRATIPDYSAIIRHNAEMAAARAQAEALYGPAAVNAMLYAPNPMERSALQAIITAPAIPPSVSLPVVSPVIDSIVYYASGASGALTDAKPTAAALPASTTIPILGVLLAGVALLLIVPIALAGGLK